MPLRLRAKVTFCGSPECYLPTRHPGKSLHTGSAEQAPTMVKVEFSSSFQAAAGQQSANCSTEACTLLVWAQTLNQEERLSADTVLDLLQVHCAKSSITRSNITQELFLLHNKHLWPPPPPPPPPPQWTPSHCDVGGIEEEDQLSKVGGTLEKKCALGFLLRMQKPS